MGGFLSTQLAFRRSAGGSWQLDPDAAAANSAALLKLYDALVDTYQRATSGEPTSPTSESLEARVLLETLFVRPLFFSTPSVTVSALRLLRSELLGRGHTRITDELAFSSMAPLVVSKDPTAHAALDSVRDLPSRLHGLLKLMQHDWGHSPSTVEGLSPGSRAGAIPACLGAPYAVSQVDSRTASRGAGGTLVTVHTAYHVLQHLGFAALIATDKSVLSAAAAAAGEHGTTSRQHSLVVPFGDGVVTVSEPGIEDAIAAELARVVDGVLDMGSWDHRNPKPRGATAPGDPISIGRKPAPPVSGAEALQRGLFGLLNSRSVAGMAAADLDSVARCSTVSLAYHTLRGMILAPFVAPADDSDALGRRRGLDGPTPRRRDRLRGMSVIGAFHSGTRRSLAASDLGTSFRSEGGRANRVAASVDVEEVVAAIRAKVSDGSGAVVGAQSNLADNDDELAPREDAAGGKAAWAALLGKLKVPTANEVSVSPAIRTTKADLQGKLERLAVVAEDVADDDVLCELVGDTVAALRAQATASEVAASQAAWNDLCVDAASSADEADGDVATVMPTHVRHREADTAPSAMRQQSTNGDAATDGAGRQGSSRRVQIEGASAVRFQAEDDAKTEQRTEAADELMTGDDAAVDLGDDLLTAQRTLRAVFFLCLESVDARLLVETAADVMRANAMPSVRVQAEVDHLLAHADGVSATLTLAGPAFVPGTLLVNLEIGTSHSEVSAAAPRRATAIAADARAWVALVDGSPLEHGHDDVDAARTTSSGVFPSLEAIVSALRCAAAGPPPRAALADGPSSPAALHHVPAGSPSPVPARLQFQPAHERPKHEPAPHAEAELSPSVGNVHASSPRALPGDHGSGSVVRSEGEEDSEKPLDDAGDAAAACTDSWQRRRAHMAAELNHMQQVVRADRAARRSHVASFTQRLRSGDSKPDDSPDGADCEAVIARYEAAHPETRRRLAAAAKRDVDSSDDENDDDDTPEAAKAAQAASGSSGAAGGGSEAIASILERMIPRKGAHVTGKNARRPPSQLTTTSSKRSLKALAGAVGAIVKTQGALKSRSPPKQRSRLATAPQAVRSWNPPDDLTFSKRLAIGDMGLAPQLVPYTEQPLHDYAIRGEPGLPVRAFAASDDDRFMTAVTLHDLQYEEVRSGASLHGMDLPTATGDADRRTGTSVPESLVPLLPPRGQRATIQPPWLESLRTPRSLPRVAFALTCLQDVDFRGKPAQRRLAKLDGHRLLLALIADGDEVSAALRTRAAKVLTAATRDRRCVVILQACDVERLIIQRISQVAHLVPSSTHHPPPKGGQRRRATSAGAPQAAEAAGVSGQILDDEAALEVASLATFGAALATASLTSERKLREACESLGGCVDFFGRCLSAATRFGEASSDVRLPCISCLSSVARLAQLLFTTRESAATARMSSGPLHKQVDGDAASSIVRATHWVASHFRRLCLTESESAPSSPVTGDGVPTDAAVDVELPTAVRQCLSLLAMCTLTSRHVRTTAATLRDLLCGLIPHVAVGAEGKTTPLRCVTVQCEAEGDRVTAVCSEGTARILLLALIALGSALQQAADPGARQLLASRVVGDVLPRLEALLAGIFVSVASSTPSLAPVTRGSFGQLPVTFEPAFPPLPDPQRVLLRGDARDDDAASVTSHSQSVLSSRPMSHDGAASVVSSRVTGWGDGTAADDDPAVDHPYQALDGCLPSVTLAQYVVSALSNLGSAAQRTASQHALAGIAPLLLRVAGIDELLFPRLHATDPASAEVRGMASALWRSVNAAREHALSTLASAATSDVSWLRSAETAGLVLGALQSSGDERITRNSVMVLAGAADRMGVAAASVHPNVLPALAGLLRRASVSLQHPAAVTFANILDAAERKEAGDVSDAEAQQARAVAGTVVDLLLPHCGAVLDMVRISQDDIVKAEPERLAEATMRSHDASRLLGWLARHSAAVAAMLNQRSAVHTIASVIPDLTSALNAVGGPQQSGGGGLCHAWVFFAVDSLLSNSHSYRDACEVVASPAFVDALVAAFAARHSAGGNQQQLLASAGAGRAPPHDELRWGINLARTLLSIAAPQVVPRLVDRGAVQLLTQVLSDGSVHASNKDTAREVVKMMRDERHAARGSTAPAARPPPPQMRPYSRHRRSTSHMQQATTQ